MRQCIWTVLIAILGVFAVNYFVMSRKLISVDFEVFGTVQGVFFRKYTEKEAKKLGLTGWCMNTEKGTVQGCMEGEEGSIKHMKRWLESTGSPQSKIDKAVFTNEKELKSTQFKSFDIRR